MGVRVTHPWADVTVRVTLVPSSSCDMEAGGAQKLSGWRRQPPKGAKVKLRHDVVAASAAAGGVSSASAAAVPGVAAAKAERDVRRAAECRHARGPRLRT